MNLIQTINEEYSSIEESTKETLHIDNRNVSNIISAYKRFLDNLSHSRETFISEKEAHEIGMFSVPYEKMQYTPEDITSFSLELEQFQSEKFFLWTGMFLTELVLAHHRFNQSQEKYVLLLNQLGKKIHYVGNNLGHWDSGVKQPFSNLLVHGDVGDYFCQDMKQGNVTLIGSAGDNVGRYAKAKSITVQGNVGNGLGSCSKGIHILVEGNAGNSIGGMMNGGSITVTGETGFGKGEFIEEGIISVDNGKYIIKKEKGKDAERTLKYDWMK